MGQIVTTYQQLPQHIQSLTLGLSQFRLRLTYRKRIAAWYADLYTLSGTPIWLGQRVSTRWGMGLGLNAENEPDGVLYVRGPAEYVRANLGDTVRLVFYPTAELPVDAGDTYPITVTVP